MEIKDFTSLQSEEVSSLFLKMAQYAANQCTGCSDSPIFLAFKAQQAMLEAYDKGEDPFEKLNSFLGTSIPEDVLLNVTI